MDSYFIFLNKPAGITSQQLLTQYKKTLPRKTKVGHHGTLDPFATGLMLVAVGEACKFLPYVDDARKTYVATLKLGQKTETGDPEGQVIEEKPVPDLHSQQIEDVLKSLIGPMKQLPPMYSAVKVQGRKLYEYARQGQEVERKARMIEIFDLKILGYDSVLSTLQFETACSRGTYIRTLGEKISERLDTVGHLILLTRTKLSGQNLESDSIQIPLELDHLLQHLPQRHLTSQERKNLYYGKVLPVLNSDAKILDCAVRLYCEGLFFGIGRLTSNDLKVEKLLQNKIGLYGT